MPMQVVTYYTTITGHEHLYAFGLINMNGRMYDPLLSSFLSPDNYMQDPTTQQGFNRYAYCMYNLLKYVDPSGELCRGWGSSTYYLEMTFKNMMKERYSQYLELMEMTLNHINEMIDGLFSMGDNTGGMLGENHGCGGGSVNPNNPTTNGNADGDPTNNTPNPNDTQNGDEKHLISPDYLWIKCHFWYLYCNRQDMHIDASKMNFDFLSFNDLTSTSDGNYSINLYDYKSDCPQLAAALGEITLIPAGDDYYNIQFDTYDFDLHRNKDGEWLTKRNAATLFAGFLFYGVIDNYHIIPSPSMFFGGKFDIYFDGKVYIKRP